jgi:hypothetical protein
MPDPKDIDPRLWGLDPGALGGPPSSPVSLSSPAIEHILIQAAMLSSPFGRKLSSQEIELIKSIFGESVDTARIRIVEASIANAPTTLGNQIRVRPGYSFGSEEGQSTLIHETAHVWQYQTQGTRYITCAIYHQVKADIKTGTRNAAYMNYKLNSRSKISNFPAEEQAQIIQDYYEILRANEITVRKDGGAPMDMWVKMRQKNLPDYERLIKEVRTYRPMPQQQIYVDSLMKEPGGRYLPPSSSDETRTLPLMPILEFRFKMPWEK